MGKHKGHCRQIPTVAPKISGAPTVPRMTTIYRARVLRVDATPSRPRATDRSDGRARPVRESLGGRAKEDGEAVIADTTEINALVVDMKDEFGLNATKNPGSRRTPEIRGRQTSSRCSIRSRRTRLSRSRASSSSRTRSRRASIPSGPFARPTARCGATRRGSPG